MFTILKDITKCGEMREEFRLWRGQLPAVHYVYQCKKLRFTQLDGDLWYFECLLHHRLQEICPNYKTIHCTISKFSELLSLKMLPHPVHTNTSEVIIVGSSKHHSMATKLFGEEKILLEDSNSSNLTHNQIPEIYEYSSSIISNKYMDTMLLLVKSYTITTYLMYS